MPCPEMRLPKLPPLQQFQKRTPLSDKAEEEEETQVTSNGFSRVSGSQTKAAKTSTTSQKRKRTEEEEAQVSSSESTSEYFKEY